jgi:hypothetical protein
VGDSAFGALLAAPLASAAVVDCAGIDEGNDADLLKANLFFPGLRRIGSLQGLAALAAPNPLFVHNVKNVETNWLAPLYQEKPAGLRQQNERASDYQIADWLARWDE